MWFGIVTALPELVEGLFREGVARRSREAEVLRCEYFTPRDHVSDVHRSIDDRPYGGGPGMVMLSEPLAACLRDARAASPDPDTPVLYLTPQGDKLDQRLVNELSSTTSLILLAGRYEGIDQRLLDAEVDREISIGDYVISGGELACMVLIDAVARQLPGTLGNPGSIESESHVDNLLDYPQYTRPREFQGRQVPTVLLSGDHAAIEEWRARQAVLSTWCKRPDLMSQHDWTSQEKRWLREFVPELVVQSSE